MFALRQNYKDESHGLMQNLIKLIMKSLDGVQIRKDINESHKCKCPNWMETERDNVIDYWII